MQLLIDVVGTCNLKCPSCPVGNSPEVKNTKGVMNPELLNAILVKAMGECTVDSVALFNWTDPLINPRLPELVQTVKNLGLPCYISSNLNLLKNEDALMLANPDLIRVSMSGYTQENYGINHRGGEISKVLENLERLVAARSRTGSKTIIDIMYHRYLGNLDDEFKLRELANRLGVKFETSWAFLMPVEKILAFAYNDSRFSPMNEEDREVIKRLALPFDEAISIAEYHREQSCSLIENQIVMDVQGNVILCCGIYDQDKYKLGNFLDRSFSEITNDKYQLEKCKSICGACTKKGVHVYVTYDRPEFDQVATQNVLQHYAEALVVKVKPYNILIKFLAKYMPNTLKVLRKIRKYIRQNYQS
ncbi:MAG: SPASM domain-containing protein [Methylococcales bacterium]